MHSSLYIYNKIERKELVQVEILGLIMTIKDEYTI